VPCFLTAFGVPPPGGLHGIAPQRRAGTLGFIVGAYSVFVLVTPGGLHSTAPRHRTGRSRSLRRSSTTSSSFGGGTHTGTEGGGGEGGRGVPRGVSY